MKDNLVYTFIIAILLVVLYETCKKNKTVNTNTSSSDTITNVNYVYFKDSGKTKPLFIRGRRDTVFENSIEYVPSEDYSTLVKQFQELKEILLSRNIYRDSLHLDSLGWVKITDTVQKNNIIGRQYVNNIKIPERVRNITTIVQAPQRRQLYLGASVFANPTVKNAQFFRNNTTTYITNVNGSLLYKDRKDRMFGGGVQWDGKDINYGLSTYIKLSFRKTNK